MAVSPHLAELARTWRNRIGRSLRAMLVAIVFAAVLGGAHLARLGTPWARLVVAVALAVVVVGIVVRALRERKAFGDARRTIGRVLVPTDRALGHRALRALTVVERTRDDATVGSPDLAAHHFDRLLERASADAIDQTARRRSDRFSIATVVLAAAALVAVLVGPVRIVEGLDILVARDGRAPLDISYLTLSRVSAQAPSYLRRPDRVLFTGASSVVPEGSILTVQGVARYAGRKLVLTDGEREVPFVGDGAGGVVARWNLDRSAELRVAARFGSVVIEEPEPLWVSAVRDDAPDVDVSVRTPWGDVEPTPLTLSLRDLDRIEIQYSAVDDHGLRQVDLVLRAGSREDRRMLTRFDGESSAERGGHVLFARDAFLRRMFLPVLVTVEARDNDPNGGDKWGKSEPLTLLPPAVGEAEADRYQRLMRARDRVASLLAWRIDNSKAAVDAELRAEHRAAERRLLDETVAELEDAVEPKKGRLAPSEGLASFVLGQAKVLRRRVPRGGSPTRVAADALLAIDKAARRLGYRDARTVSKRLGDVAEEAADGAKAARETEQRAAGIARLDAALAAVEDGAGQLSKLGALGMDIGSVALADLGRIRRARAEEALARAEAVARHLAARLRRPNPSFGSAGSSRRGGVESGLLGMGDASGEPSQSDERFDQLAGELESLAREHAGEIAEVERAIGDAERAVDLEDMAEEAKRRAEAVRRAVANLPFAGAEPGSARATAALAREHASAMASSLEQMSLSEAVQSGRSAMSALEAARRRLDGSNDPFDRLDERTLEAAEKKLEEQLSWAEDQLRRVRHEVRGRSSRALGQSSEREQELSQRAGNLASRGRISESALPEEVVADLERAASAMAEAARALQERNGDRGLARQREAQRLLERANTGKTTDAGERGRSRRDQRRGEEGRQMRTDATVPDEREAGAEDFRKRVLRGLGEPKGSKLAPAVRRYADGLLR